ncbi:unnamed protein product [Echinostoma caproni]|uniref:phosphoglucomutase (alpha-D-glucose-1,6-bisphosphate-dependent) n=1 Tax=Echinostoma caproni TaxID=27848 RepID=A0A183B1U2_9TREM|nr:unnamed protein product [Echinostoma caproni]
MLGIATDSKFVKKCATEWGPIWEKNGWKLSTGQPVKLREPVERLLEATRDSDVDVAWVRRTIDVSQSNRSGLADYFDMATYTIETKSTKAFPDQKPGTSGLRKPTKTFMQPMYTENFVQSILTAALHDMLETRQHVRLVLGGDGRYFVKESLLQIIIPMCAANGVSEVLVGQSGILSTPAASCVIRKYNLNGGIILTASHNPGGVDADFGIKYNCENGGPAPEKVTNKIYEISKSLSSYKTLVEPMQLNLDVIGTSEFHLNNGQVFRVNVISSVDDYTAYIGTLFDFGAIRNLLSGTGGNPPFKLLVSGLHGVTGPYIKEIFCKQLGMPANCALKAEPLVDFGKGHPDPNLTYAADLVQAVVNDPTVSFAAAFDGDGDRNMLIGQRGFFISPCDSLAVIADNAASIKYFQQTGLRGCARSMPTSRALDRVLLCGRATLLYRLAMESWRLAFAKFYAYNAEQGEFQFTRL